MIKNLTLIAIILTPLTVFGADCSSNSSNNTSHGAESSATGPIVQCHLGDGEVKPLPVLICNHYKLNS